MKNGVLETPFRLLTHEDSVAVAKPSNCSRLVNRLKIATNRVTVAMM